MDSEVTSPVFLKLRAIAFLCITMLSLMWIVLLCIIIFYRWDISDHLERSLILVILLANTVTVIALPVLILLQFRPWLDAARFSFLLVAHIGTAASFTMWNPNFTCPQQTADQESECKLVNMYILLGNWVVPGFLISYAVGLALMVYRHTRRSAISKLSSESDREAAVGRHPTLPMMRPDAASVTIEPNKPLIQGYEHLDTRKSVSFPSRERTARLSKPIPALYF